MPRADRLFRLLHALRMLPQPVTAARLALLRDFIAQLRARPNARPPR